MNILSNSEPIDQLFATAQIAAQQLGGALDRQIQASIIVPVNAQGDILTVLHLMEDLQAYGGPYSSELVLVINNYASDAPPVEIEHLRLAGVQVVAEPDAHRPGEVVIISARALGVREAHSSITIHFDADCHIPHPTTLLNWYIEQLREKASLAYSHVSFYDLRKDPSVRIKIAFHHFVRFVKRALLKIPTTRGSNYAIRRELFLKLYQEGKISVDLQVGPAAKKEGAKIVYSADKSLYVFTSGRRFKGGWRKLPGYAIKRLIYNIRSLQNINQAEPVKKWDGYDRENKSRHKMDLSATQLPPVKSDSLSTRRRD